MGALTVLLFSHCIAAEPVTVIRGATVYDGNDKPGRRVDVLIRGASIDAIGTSLKIPKSAHVIDATGLIVAPGFIDLHTHSDRSLTRPSTSVNLNYLFQGVTTAVTGNCGSGPVDIAAYFRNLEKAKQGSNVVHLVPHNSLRRAVMGNSNREPTDKELSKMKDLMAKGMKDGAYGMSTGLIYNPGTYAKTDEIVALASVVGKHRGIYVSHIRGEGVTLLPATQEAIDIGKRAGTPVHISHMKASGHRTWGRSVDSIALIMKARKQGQQVTADQYPYSASSTSLQATLVPPRFREGTRKDFLKRLDDADLGPTVRKGIADTLKAKRNGIGIQIAGYSKRRDWQGLRLPQIAKKEKKSVFDLVLEIERNGGASIVNFNMSEEDVRLIMRQKFVATASDGSSRLPSDTVPHPRSYGCYPRKIGLYAIKEKVVTLEHAIRSASGLPADILSLPKRGYIKKGYFADLVVLDPKRIRDVATFERPHQYSEGVVHLFVNGVSVIEKGRYTGARPGKVLRHGK